MPKFLREQTNRYWNGIGIYPQALAKRGKVSEFRQDAIRQLQGIGRSNLLLLCEQSRIGYRDDAHEAAIAKSLIRGGCLDSLVHLREFLKRRTEALELVYSEKLSDRKRGRITSHLRTLSRSESEIIKPFTKLLILFQDDPKHLADVFFLDLWRSRSSGHEYIAQEPLDDSVSGQLNATRQQLAERLGAVTGLTVTALSPHTLSNGVTVMVFVREYLPRVKRDFYQTYNVHYDCGLIVAGFDKASARFHLKISNKKLAKAFEQYLAIDLGLTPELLKNQVFSNFDAERSRRALMGQFAAHGIEIIAATYTRSALAHGASLSVSAPALCPSIRPALETLNENAILDVRGPGDVASLRLTFGSKVAMVTHETTDDGAVRLRFDNAGWESSEQSSFEEAFENTFGFPVNKRLNPLLIYMGSKGIYSHLLTITTEDQVEQHEHDCFDMLLDEGILRREPTQVRGCRSNVCPFRLQIVTDDSQTVCRQCGKELESWTIDAIARDHSKAAEVVGKLIEEASGWRLLTASRQFESYPYFALVPPQSDLDDDEVCVLVQDRVSAKLQRTFERYSRPMLVIQAKSDENDVFVDGQGLGRLSLAYALAASQTPDERPRLIEQCSRMLSHLRISHQERIQKAARHSYAILQGERGGLTGNKYETEIFNIVRAIFPESHQLGREGRAEPDGFVTLHDYRTAQSPSEPQMWNWTYDAKLSELAKGYRLDRDERRKAKEYIEKFRRNRTALMGDRRLQAHVFIANNISETKMKGMAAYLYGPDGLSKSTREMKLAFMDEQYLLALYEWSQQNQNDWRQRRIYVGELLIRQIERADPYRHLAAADAIRLTDELMKFQIVSGRISRHVLEESLEETAI